MASQAALVFNTLLLFLLLPWITLLPSAATSNGIERKTYIVRVQTNLKPSVFTNIENWYSSTLKTTQASSPTEDTAILHVYRTVFHGFSATLSPAEAQLLRRRPGVLAVLPDTARRLHTTRSPLFLGLVSSNSNPQAILTGSDFGANVVVAVLDTGISPEHRSFNDSGLGPAPSKWKGVCDAGPGFPADFCNHKLIGARFFPGGFISSLGGRPNLTADTLSPRDTDGHGTHTASTAAGRPADRAAMFGYAAGVASGVAPKARIAAYKVCWSSGCFDSDILAAIDHAVEDGADIISLSVGAGPAPYHLDPIAIGAFGATEKGVLVVTSAGNDGPGEMTVTNVAPWIATVGAGTIDRTFPADVVLGDGTIFTGTSLYAGKPLPANATLSLVYAGNASTTRLGYRSSAPFCMRGSLDPASVAGRVVLCERGAIPRVEKGLAVLEAGGAGIIIANQSPDGEGLVPDAHLIPAIAVGVSAGYSIHTYIRTTADPLVTLRFRGTQVGIRPAPTVASFSARGPSAQSPYLIKPDLVAPGVGVLAAWPTSMGPTGLPADTRRTEFNIVSGTSMSCPHVSGVAALLKGVHPEWSPASVRSALMTTAYVVDNKGDELLDESTGNTSTVWAMGSGHVDPERAVDPGLVYDLTSEDYVGFLCASKYTRRDIRTIARRPVNCRQTARKPWDLNYPSISVVLEQTVAAGGTMEVNVSRTVTSVAEGAAEYTASFKVPTGASIAVEPETLVFKRKGEKLGFVVRVWAMAVSLPPGISRTEFGSLTWNDGKHTVRSPVAVTWQQPYWRKETVTEVSSWVWKDVGV